MLMVHFSRVLISLHETLTNCPVRGRLQPAEQLDRFNPPLRMLLILDNLVGHYSRDLVNWCYGQGIGLLYTPCAGSWLNMATGG